MNRCIKPLPQAVGALFFAAWAALLLAQQASAQARPFPATAMRAAMVVTQPPVITLNGRSERLSPGARIKGSNNMLVMSASLVGQKLLVNYVRDPQGLVHGVWILSEAEAAEKRPGMETVTNVVFGSDADKPKTDDGKTPFDQLPKYRP